MTDLFGQVEERAPFTDIRNQRDSVAHEKALLCAELNGLLRRTPPPERIACIQDVTKFKAAHESALKVLRGKHSSRAELRSAISAIRLILE